MILPCASCVEPSFNQIVLNVLRRREERKPEHATNKQTDKHNIPSNCEESQKINEMYTHADLAKENNKNNNNNKESERETHCIMAICHCLIRTSIIYTRDYLMKLLEFNFTCLYFYYHLHTIKIVMGMILQCMRIAERVMPERVCLCVC